MPSEPPGKHPTPRKKTLIHYIREIKPITLTVSPNALTLFEIRETSIQSSGVQRPKRRDVEALRTDCPAGPSALHQLVFLCLLFLVLNLLQFLCEKFGRTVTSLSHFQNLGLSWKVYTFSCCHCFHVDLGY